MKAYVTQATIDEATALVDRVIDGTQPLLYAMIAQAQALLDAQNA